MQYRKLGRTGVEVSALCLGCMTYGWEPQDWGTPEEEGVTIIRAALDAGINFLDTANVYARGVNEQVVGRAIAGRRHAVFLATKVHGRMGDGPNLFGNTRLHIMRQCEESLSRLNTDYIDLYQLHRPHPEVPIDETLRAMDDLIRQGKVRYIGTSTFAAWQLCEALYIARELGLNHFVSEQPPYNLLDRRIERELLPFCRTYDIAVIPWSPLAGGQLSGKYLNPDTKGARYSGSDPNHRVNEATSAVVSELVAIAEKYGMTPTELAYAWCLSRPGVTCPIIGARSLDQLHQNLKVADISLPEEAAREIDEVAPPGSHTLAYYEANFGPNARPI